MVDFKRKLSSGKVNRKTEPQELYKALDRKSLAGPLRPAQEYILDEWYQQHHDDKDLIIKLHTGEGKTLIGLLILQSMINSKEGPCLYVCPNIYLVSQVCAEAEKFGIPYCTIGADRQIPNEFLSGEKILITHAHKIFNGKSVFGIDNNYVRIGTIILDDSHACVDVIKEAFTITISRNANETLYQKIVSLFNDDLMEQGEGSFLDIQAGDYETFMPVPYWSWMDKRVEVLKILSEFSSDDSIQYVWQLMRDKIKEYCCYISGNIIEISPYNPNVDTFGSFSRAKHRILMSATTQDDAFFVKGLSFSTDAVKHPLVNANQKWSGEKMIILPSLFSDECDRDLVVTKFAKMENKKFGMIALVPNTKRAEHYKNLGAICADKNSIFPVIETLKKGEFSHIVVINNRYDGIDLPDESCRVLIIDSMPFFNSLSDKYEEKCRPNSEIINKRIAQKIEQGIGRGVRGEKDYCAILVIGSDIVKFMRSMTTNKYFSIQTQKQIDIGLEIAKMAQDEQNSEDSPIKSVISLINQMLNRDEGWKEYYTDEMDSIENVNGNSSIYEQLLEESRIEKLYCGEEYEKASTAMQKIIDSLSKDELESGWYLQQLARYTYPIYKEKSIQLQKAAFKCNSQLLKPKTGIEYTRVSYIHENRLKRIHAFLGKYENYSELNLVVDEISDNLSFGMEAEKFESALKSIGELLGYISQRPDKEFRKGPDNLWCGTNNQYNFFECKSEVEDTRGEISKHEAGQMNNHCAWFEEQYGIETNVNRFLIIPTKNLSYYADFTHNVRIIRRGKLKLFKDSIKKFIKELKPYELSEITDATLQRIIDVHKLNPSNLVDTYSEEYYHKTK
ncbi:DEAD/DEAH box helicase family protein [Bacillaceae bacterium Marseille-Q3522]|nr:DEAD/DEAH box helicase family protein [Bacillaceae bacterium Marseille-Q3522]